MNYAALLEGRESRVWWLRLSISTIRNQLTVLFASTCRPTILTATQFRQPHSQPPRVEAYGPIGTLLSVGEPKD